MNKALKWTLIVIGGIVVLLLAAALILPAVFKDDDGSFYMYFGGIWGGQLQRWSNGKYDANGSKTDRNDGGPAIRPRVADNGGRVVVLNIPGHIIHATGCRGECGCD